MPIAELAGRRIDAVDHQQVVAGREEGQERLGDRGLARAGHHGPMAAVERGDRVLEREGGGRAGAAVGDAPQLARPLERLDRGQQDGRGVVDWRVDDPELLAGSRPAVTSTVSSLMAPPSLVGWPGSRPPVAPGRASTTGHARARRVLPLSSRLASPCMRPRWRGRPTPGGGAGRRRIIVLRSPAPGPRGWILRRPCGKTRTTAGRMAWSASLAWRPGGALAPIRATVLPARRAD